MDLKKYANSHATIADTSANPEDFRVDPDGTIYAMRDLHLSSMTYFTISISNLDEQKMAQVSLEPSTEKV